ncbi:MAG: hypothetical protein IJI67_07725, partial [Clostridia bacterium]|nr:hypothetical protein [Clostridia bacterium]
MKFKKVLSILLVAVMLLSVMPLSAFATEWTDEDVDGWDLQTGDILTSDVERLEGLEEYTLTLPAGGYGYDFEAAADSDLVITEWGIDGFDAPSGKTLSIIDNDLTRYFPYNANGMTNRWYVIDVDHDNQTITLSGSDASATPAADEVSETISLAYAPLFAISGTHYSVSADNLVGESALTINDMHPMTINARKGETITKVVLTYSTGDNKNTLFASAGTFDGDATFSNINAQQVTISSEDNVDISAVTVYFEGDLNNPTVTLTGGANAKSSGGLSTQSYLPGAMDTVTYTALADATFPEFETYTQNGVTVERTSEKVVTVSGTPTANTAITVPDAESSSKIVTWNASLINDYIADKVSSEERSYSDTANGITLTNSEGEVDYFGNSYLETYDGTTLSFSTTTGKFTSIEIEANNIYDGGNWTKDGNILKWNGTPSESVSLTGDVFIMGLSSITFVIEPAAPTPSAYAGYVPAEADDADALAAKVVKFNGYDWYMIEDNSTSETEGTVTLLAADTSFGACAFDSTKTSHEYSTSTIKATLDAMTAEDGSFAKVADAIAATDLTDVNVTGAKLWLLSSGEANNIPVNVRMCSQASEAIVNAWWLRSADSDGTIAEFVVGSNGYVANGGSGANVNQSLGVRPALKLDLSKVEFDSETKTFALPTPPTYTVTWQNADGTELETDTDVAEGTVPTYDGATPTKADDAQYTYTFSGWTPEVSAVTGDVTYTAVYSQSVRQYTVTWKNYDDSVIGTSTVNAGQTPEFSDSIGQIKAKPADENHSYEFTGWTPEIVAAEADAEYTATFVDVLSISNVDEWNSFAASVKNGNTYSGKIVRMTADVGPVTTMVAGTFSGTFDGGSHTLTVNISGGNASVATFEVVKDATIQNLTLAGSITSSGIHSAALVKSISDSGTSCTIKNVDIYADVNCAQNYIGGFIGHAGTANTVNIENSIFAGSINKTGSGQGGYIGGFIGWSQQLTATIDNCAFTGSYSNIKSFNNIGFSYNAPTKITVNDFYSNVSEVFGTSANHGTRLYTPSSSYPTTVALVNHGGEKTFFHQLSDALNAWVDGSTLMLMSDVTTANTISVGGNKTLDLNGYKLRISKNAQVISLQEGGDLTIKSSAQGGEVIGCNADRAVVGGKGQTLTLESGTIKTAASNAISGTNAVFNLNGGAIECTSNSSDMTVASAVYCKGNCTVNWNGTSITTNTGCGFYSKTTTDTVKIGGGSFAATADTLPDNAGYVLSNYNVEIQGAPVLNGKGIYLSNGRVINVTGELTNDVPIGVVMQTPGVFTSGLQGNGGIANFANGNGDDYGIGLDASGEAQVVRKYTVTWKLDETTVLATDKVLEGTVPTFTGTAPADYSDTYYNYSFSGWTPAPVAATEDATYTAAFTATAKTFTVFVKTLSGKTIFVHDVTGETTSAQIKDMLVQETGLPAAQQKLIFAGTEMANDKTLADYNIQKESTIHCVPVNYTVTWLNYDGSELASEPVGYGVTPEYTGETPVKPSTAQYTYTFAGWTPEVAAVTGDVTYTATFTAVPVVNYVAEANGVKYESFDEALRAISTVNAKGQFLANGTVRLLADCAGNGYSIASGSNLIIDFNSKTYTVDAEPLAGSTGTKTQAFQLLKNSTVIFKNGTLYSEVAKMLVQNYSDLTLEGMKLTLENPNYYPSYTLSNNNGDTMIIDSTINANSKGGF